jgi:hypothetical protein
MLAKADVIEDAAQEEIARTFVPFWLGALQNPA